MTKNSFCFLRFERYITIYYHDFCGGACNVTGKKNISFANLREVSYDKLLATLTVIIQIVEGAYLVGWSDFGVPVVTFSTTGLFSEMTILIKDNYEL